jgi:sugar transferase (PEP-CTERM/EpsH1 system associated)
MGDVLFLAHRAPFPPNKGDKIRSFHMLEYLAKRARVHLGAFVDDPDDWGMVENPPADLKALCGDIHLEKLDRGQLIRKTWPLLMTDTPLSIGFYRSVWMQDWVRRTLAAHDVSAIFLYSAAVAQFGLRHGAGRQVVMDFVDMDSDKWVQYAAAKRWPLSLVYKREARTLFALERQIAARVDASVFVSEAEAQLFRARAGLSPDQVLSINNGVDLERFKPGVVAADPRLAAGAAIVFTGAMDYWANEDAVAWFATDVLPLIQKTRPDASFWIVGGNPTASVKALSAKPGVHVTGKVVDVRPYIAGAAVCVAPMRIARGVQNKVLEAMAMGRPMVTTTQGLEGIAARPGQDLHVADDAAGQADAVLTLLSDPFQADSLGASGRRAMEAGYSWAGNLARLDDLLALRAQEGVSSASDQPQTTA